MQEKKKLGGIWPQRFVWIVLTKIHIRSHVDAFCFSCHFFSISHVPFFIFSFFSPFSVFHCLFQETKTQMSEPFYENERTLNCTFVHFFVVVVVSLPLFLSCFSFLLFVFPFVVLFCCLFSIKKLLQDKKKLDENVLSLTLNHFQWIKCFLMLFQQQKKIVVFFSFFHFFLFLFLRNAPMSFGCLDGFCLRMRFWMVI